MDLQKKRVRWFLFIAGVVLLSMTAEKFRELVGDDSASKSGKFTWINCFDMSSGTLACGAKEGAKLYVYNLRSGLVEKARQRAIEIALSEGLSGGLSIETASKQAQQAGAKAAKLATKQAKRITGPIMAAGWDFFEAVYYGGTIIEGCMRGVGTLVGAYAGGFQGEQKFGRVGYLIGSHIGNWIGGRIGLMVYDILNGVQYLVYTTSNVAADIFSSEGIYESSKTSYESSETSYESTETYEEPTETTRDTYDSETTRDTYDSESSGENLKSYYEEALEL